MRNLACFLLLVGSGVALAAETWRWVDANGVTHYSDRPMPGAERMDLKAPAPSAAPVTRPTVPAREPVVRPVAAYTRCAVVNPPNDQTFQNPQNVAVTLDVEPALQDGHRIEVLLNGSAVADWPTTALSYSLQQVYRGSYSITARILDEQARQLCAGPPISFHVRQPTVNSPARRPVPTPR